MDQSKKILFLSVYFVFFIFSFLLFFKTAMFFRGKDNGILGFSFGELSPTSLKLQIVFFTSCFLVALSSFLLVCTALSYNFDIIKDPEKPEEKEIKKIWGKE